MVRQPKLPQPTRKEIETMSKFQLQTVVKYQIAKDRLVRNLSDDRGELGSWLILAAGLAIAAGAAISQLSGWFGEKTDQIISN